MNAVEPKTIQIAIGDSYATSPGCREIDMIYRGTVDAVTFIGNKQGVVNQAVPLPPNVPFHAPFNNNGYSEGAFTITNAGDAIVYVIEYY